MSYPINLMVVDLCHYDTVLSYDKVKAAGIVGVIYKATEGMGYIDSTYPDERTKALKAGLLWGAYHFANNGDVNVQVANFIAYAQIDPASLFVLDWEDNGKNTMSLGQAQAWIEGVENALGRPGECVLYSGNVIKEKLTAPNAFFNSRRLWLPQYGSKPVLPTGYDRFWLWQYLGDGAGPEPHTVDGISGDVDCNSYDGSPEQLADEWASGVFVPPAPAPDQPTITITIDAPPGVTVNVVQNQS